MVSLIIFSLVLGMELRAFYMLEFCFLKLVGSNFRRDAHGVYLKERKKKNKKPKKPNLGQCFLMSVL